MGLPMVSSHHTFKPGAKNLAESVMTVARIFWLILHEQKNLNPKRAENWKTTHVELEVTDGCPLNNMYKRFKLWIRFSYLKPQTLNNMYQRWNSGSGFHTSNPRP